ncbi:hypothetical protein [Flavobacterium sp.]
MRKCILIVAVTAFLASCSSVPGRVCGGAGGGRCVETTAKPVIKEHKPIV